MGFVSGQLMTTQGVDNASSAGMIRNQEQGFPLLLSVKFTNVLRYAQITYYIISFIITLLFNI